MVGMVLVLIALILGGVQDLHIANIYGGAESKWYFYGAVGAVLLIGIVLLAWSLLKKEAPKQSKPR
jgi:NADH:ubiquinone oxidoreductase subunit 6 (subunit J)